MQRCCLLVEVRVALWMSGGRAFKAGGTACDKAMSKGREGQGAKGQGNEVKPEKGRAWGSTLGTIVKNLDYTRAKWESDR